MKGEEDRVQDGVEDRYNRQDNTTYKEEMKEMEKNSKVDGKWTWNIGIRKKVRKARNHQQTHKLYTVEKKRSKKVSNKRVRRIRMSKKKKKEAKVE